MATKGVKVNVVSTTTVECPVPASEAETVEFAELVRLAAASKLRLTNARPITAGGQRDPFVVAISLTFQAESRAANEDTK